MAAATDTFRLSAPLWSTTLNGAISSTSTTIVLQSVTSLPTGTAISLVLDAKNAQGVLTPSLQETITGVVSAGTNSIINCVRGVEGTAQSHATGATVNAYLTAADWNAAMNGILEDHVQLGYHNTLHDINGKTWIQQQPTTNAVNYLGIQNAVTGSGPIIAAEGSDTNISLNLQGKGTGTVVLPGGAINYANLLSTIFSGQVTSYTNTGAGGGTGYYINLGGIKLCWGTTGTLGPNSGYYGGTISLPASFFTSVLSAQLWLASIGSNQDQSITGNSGYSTTSIPYYWYSSVNGTTTIAWFVIGT